MISQNILLSAQKWVYSVHHITLSRIQLQGHIYMHFGQEKVVSPCERVYGIEKHLAISANNNKTNDTCMHKSPIFIFLAFAGIFCAQLLIFNLLQIRLVVDKFFNLQLLVGFCFVIQSKSFLFYQVSLFHLNLLI